MRRIMQFKTSLDIDTPWGNLSFSGIVEHDDRGIQAITAHFGGTDYERIEKGPWPVHSATPSGLARALWPLLVAEITSAHRDSDLAEPFEAEPPRLYA